MSSTSQICRKKNLKIITGLNNFSVDQIIEIVNAADIAGVTYLDIAANPRIVKEVKKHTNLPICVSSISLKDLYYSAIAGADLIEIGNYDFFYQQGIFLSRQHILSLARNALNLFPGFDICVTIPYTLSLNDQIDLSCQLENLGVQILQTESLKIKSEIENLNLTQLINMASPVLSSTYAISKVVKVPVIAASGINYILASLAMLYGASGIGLSTSIINCYKSCDKFNYMKEIMKSLEVNNKINTSYFLSSILSDCPILS